MLAPILGTQIQFAPVLCAVSNTGSMRPVLAGGELVLVVSRPIGEVRRGQVVVFSRGAALIIHRVIARGEVDGETWLATKGDANEVRDSGRVTASEFVVVVALPKI